MTGRVRQLFDRSIDRLRARLDVRAERQYFESPLCAVPLAPPDEYRRRWEAAKARIYPSVDRYEQDCGAAIDPTWFHELALLTQTTIKRSELCYVHGRLLYSSLRRYLRSHPHDQVNILETGTARGFSALCMAKALDDAGAAGKIISCDVLPHDAPILWNCLRDAEGARTRADLLRGYAALLERYLIFQRGDTRRELAKLSVPRIHVAFLDSVHEYDHVMAEFEAIRGRQLAGDILFFDDYDIKAYPGVVRAADEICRTHGFAARLVDAGAHRQYLIAEKLS